MNPNNLGQCFLNCVSWFPEVPWRSLESQGFGKAKLTWFKKKTNYK